jgi:WD40 repeat protein
VHWRLAKKSWTRLLCPDGKTVATAGKGDQFSLKIWDVASGKILKELKNAQAPIGSLEYDDPGQWLVAVDNSGVLRVFNSVGWEPTLTLNNTRASTMSQDRKTLVTVDEKGTCNVDLLVLDKGSQLPAGQERAFASCSTSQAIGLRNISTRACELFKRARATQYWNARTFSLRILRSPLALEHRTESGLPNITNVQWHGGCVA